MYAFLAIVSLILTPPHATLSFSGDVKLDQWATTFELTTASGANYEKTILFGVRGNMHTEKVMEELLAANWLVEAVKREVRIYGVRTKDGKGDAIKSLAITNRIVKGFGRMPGLTATGGAKASATDDEQPAKVDPMRKVPSAGPVFADDPFVELDFAPVPKGEPCLFWEFKFDLRTTAGKEEPNLQFTIEVNAQNAAEYLLDFIGIYWRASYKVEQVGKTKVRFYGAVYQGRYYPAADATIKSKHLVDEQLPKVTPPKKP